MLRAPSNIYVALIVCFLAERTASAQMDMSNHVMEMQDEISPDQLPVPQKMTGIGNAHIQITGGPETQMWFDQGLNLIHDFWDYESARAFEQSIRLEPQCAICYWGLFKAESFYHSTSQGYAGRALEKAVSLKDKASEHERLYIEATAAQRNARTPVQLSEAVALWRKLVRQYREDTQALVFLSQAVNRNESLQILESVMKDKADDSAANHYYIHALEASDHPERALHSAEILASLAPSSGHMVHMPGHIFFRLGDYARAEQAFTASLKVDEAYMRDQHVQPDNDWNYVHNLMYAIANLMEEGKLNEASMLSMKLSAGRGKLETTLYTYLTRDSITRINPQLPVALRTGNWAQATKLLKASAPPAGRPNIEFLARQLAAFSVGMQAVEHHHLGKAQKASARFDADLSRMTQQLKSLTMNAMAANKSPDDRPKIQVMPDALLQPLLSSLSVMSLELRASLLTAQGKAVEAQPLFDKAAQQEKALGYREPPSYIRPVGETEAGAMLGRRRWAQAKTAYQQALLERPRSGFALYGIALSSERSGDKASATKEYSAFLAAWKDADRSLAQLTHALGYLAARVPSGARTGN